MEDGEEDGAEEGDLQEAEHDQPREQEVAHSPAASKRERERGDKSGQRENRRDGIKERVDEGKLLSPGGPDEEDDRGKQKDELDGPGNQDVGLARRLKEREEFIPAADQHGEWEGERAF